MKFIISCDRYLFWNFWFLFAICHLSFQSIEAQEDTIAVKGRIKQAINFQNNNLDSAIYLLNTAFEQSKEIAYNDGAAEALGRAGQMYSRKGDYNQGIIVSLQALPWCKKARNKVLVSICYNNIGQAYFYLGEYARAASYFDTAIRGIQYYKISPAPPLIVSTYSNLAAIYGRFGQPQKALQYLEAAERLARQEHYEYNLAYVLLNKGSIYSDDYQLNKAMVCFKEALELGEKTGNNEIQISADINLGEVLTLQNKTNTGILYFQRAITLSKQYKLPTYWIGASYSLARAYLQIKKYHSVIQTLEPAIKQARQAELNESLQNAHQTLSKAYEATGQFAKALKEQQDYISLKDSLMGIDQAKAINDLEVKYRTAQKDKEAAQKDKEITKSKLEIANQKLTIGRKNTWLWVSSLGALMIAVSSVLFYRNIRHRRDLDNEKVRVMEQEQDIQLLKAMMQGEERERIRIGRELHDGIGGLLSAAKMNFDTLRIHNAELADAKNFRNTLQLIDEATGELRKTAHNLMPEILLKGGLGEAIRSFCDRLPKENAPNIQVHVYGNLPRLDASFELSVYRIIQEQIQNIIKHAKATEAMVQINWPGDISEGGGQKADFGGRISDCEKNEDLEGKNLERLFQIAVEDNGIGISIEDMQKDSGIGLKNMQARIRALEGHMEIESKPGVRTAIYIEFAVEKIKLAGG